MRRLKLFGLFLSLAVLALVNPREAEDMVKCAEAGANKKTWRFDIFVNGRALRDGRRAGDAMNTNGWLVIVAALAASFSMFMAALAWRFAIGGV